MRLRSGPEHRLPGPPPTHPFSRSTMSNIDPTREHPREQVPVPASRSGLIRSRYCRVKFFVTNFRHARSTKYSRAIPHDCTARGRSARRCSHLGETPNHKVLGRLGNLSLTVTEGNGMFQFVNQSRLKIRHLWCSSCGSTTRFCGQSSQPDSDGGDGYDSEEVPRGFFVACCDTSEVLEFAEAAFDEMAFFVEVLVEREFFGA